MSSKRDQDRTIGNAESSESASSPRRGAGRVWIALSGAMAVLSLALWLPTAREIDRYDGYHVARFGHLVLGIALGLLGGILAGVALWRTRGSSRWATAALVLNLVVATVVAIHARWPRTPEVMQAVRDGDAARVRAYAKLGVGLDGRERWGWYRENEGATPLTAAVANGDATMVATLLECGADLHATDGRQQTALHQAVISQHPALVEFLLSQGANIDQRGDEGDTPLLTAIRHRSLDLLELLLTRGADPRLGHPIGRLVQISPAEISGPGNWSEPAVAKAIELLARHGADLNGEVEHGRTPLTAAILAGHGKAMLQALVANGAELARQDAHADTPLVLAAQVGDLSAIRLLLDSGANVDHSGTRGKSPLTAALLAGQLPAAEVLLQAGAELGGEDNFHRSPVLAAVTGSILHDRPEILRFVLERGAPPTRTNHRDNRNSPLAVAAGSGRLELARMLLDAGVAPDEPHQQDATPLRQAIAGGHLEMVRLLLSRGAAVNHRNARNQTPLDYARECDHRDIEALLLEQATAP